MFTCSKCKGEFRYKSNLYYHLRTIHGQEDPVPRKHKSSILCTFCGKYFQTNFSLKRHVKQIHKIVDNRPKINSRIKCPICGWSEARNYHVLRQHFLEDHNMELPVEEFLFSSFEEFTTWKNEYESQNDVSYVLDSGPEKKANNVVKRHYYCHRSHTYKPKGQNLRSIKKGGSNKIGGGCPSTMELTIDNSGTHYVKLWPHSQELVRCHLAERDRANIDGEFSEGVTLQKVQVECIPTFIKEEDQTEALFSCFDSSISEVSSEQTYISDEIKEKCELLLELSSGVELNSDSKRILVEHLDKAIELLSTEKVNFKKDHL